MYRISAARTSAAKGDHVRVLGIHHIGAAVESLEPVEKLLARLMGVESVRGRPPPGSDLTFAMVGVGRCAMELMEPSREGSVVGRFLSRRGEGLHHIAFEVEDPLPGVNGTLTAFVHPSGTHGMLLEFVQEPDEGP